MILKAVNYMTSDNIIFLLVDLVCGEELFFD